MENQPHLPNVTEKDVQEHKEVIIGHFKIIELANGEIRVFGHHPDTKERRRVSVTMRHTLSVDLKLESN